MFYDEGSKDVSCVSVATDRVGGRVDGGEREKERERKRERERFSFRSSTSLYLTAEVTFSSSTVQKVHQVREATHSHMM